MSSYFKNTDTDDNQLYPLNQDDPEFLATVSENSQLVIFEFEVTQERFVFDADKLRQFLINTNFVDAVLPITSEDTLNFMQTTLVTVSVMYNAALSPIVRIIKTITACCKFFTSLHNTSRQEITLNLKLRETEEKYNFSKDDIAFLTNKSVISPVHLRMLIGRFMHMYPVTTSKQIEKNLFENYDMDLTKPLLHYDFEKYTGRVTIPEITITHSERLNTFYFQLNEEQTLSLLPIALSGRFMFREQKAAAKIFDFANSPSRTWMFKLQTSNKWHHENETTDTLFLAGHLGFFYGYDKTTNYVRSQDKTTYFSPLCGLMFVMLSLDTSRPVAEQLAGTEFEEHSQVFQDVLNDITSDPANKTPFRKLTYHH